MSLTLPRTAAALRDPQRTDTFLLDAYGARVACCIVDVTPDLRELLVPRRDLIGSQDLQLIEMVYDDLLDLESWHTQAALDALTEEERDSMRSLGYVQLASADGSRPGSSAAQRGTPVVVDECYRVVRRHGVAWRCVDDGGETLTTATIPWGELL